MLKYFADTKTSKTPDLSILLDDKKYLTRHTCCDILITKVKENTINQKGTMMKKLCVMMILFMLMLSSVCCADKYDDELTEFYPRLVLISDVNVNDDVVTCIGIDGNIWQFYGADNYAVGDVCILMMWNNSDDITEHEILAVYYEGYIVDNVYYSQFE